MRSGPASGLPTCDTRSLRFLEFGWEYIGIEEHVAMKCTYIMVDVDTRHVPLCPRAGAQKEPPPAAFSPLDPSYAQSELEFLTELKAGNSSWWTGT